MTRENYYLLLGLDPDKDTSWAVIEPKFKKKRDLWSQQSIVAPDGVKRATYKGYLRLADDMKRVLQDDALRKQEADEARGLIAKAKADDMAKLDELVRLIGAKGHLTPDDVKSLVKTGAGKWTEADARAAAARASVPVQAKSGTVDTPEERLDPSIDESITKCLQFLNKDGKGATNLYEFLEVPRSASTAALLKKTNDESAELHKNAVKDETVNIRQKLLGHCLDAFKTDKDREKYDNTLRWCKLAEIRKLAEQVGEGEGLLSATLTAELILRGKKEGLSQARVEDAVREVAAKRKWMVEKPGANAVPANLQRCGFCHTVALPEKTHCPDVNCGRPLKIACPKCSTLAPSDARACGKCSFAIGDMPLAASLIRSAKGAMATDPVAARAALAQALIFHPNHPEAKELLGQLNDREKDARRQLEAIDRLCLDRKYVAARTRIEEFAINFPGDASLPGLRKEAADALAAAAAHVQRAKALQASGKTDDAIDAFTDAVGICADFKDAADGLSRCPPEAATGAAATPLPTGVTLKWAVSPSRGKLLYLVVRKAGSQPTGSGDGDVVGRVATTMLTDDKPEPGKLYYYAVFAERGGVCAARPAVAGPVVRLAEVTGLRSVVGDGKVELQWQAPPNARRVEVWRQPLIVPSRGTGIQLNAVYGSTATDTGLVNGAPYGYRVVVAFGGPDGKDLYSDGIGLVATPVAPPLPATGLKVGRTAPGAFEVTWDPPKTGEVRVYRVADPHAIAYRPGEQVPIADLDRIGKRVPAAGPNAARDRLENMDALHVLPVTVLGQAAVAGTLVTENWVDDVERLRAWADSEAVRATWDFPTGFDTTVVLTRTDRFPDGPEDVGAHRTTWTRDQARLNGGFRLTAPDADRVFLVVYIQVNRDGRWQYSAGSRAEVAVGARRRVRYSFRKRFWSGAWELVLTPDGPTTLPELLLIASPDGFPLSPGHGQEIDRVESTDTDPSHPVVFEFKPPPWFNTRNARVFPWAEDDNQWLELIGS